jgi:hypothetical protein
VPLFFGHGLFCEKRYGNKLDFKILHEESSAPYLPNDTKNAGFWWIQPRFLKPLEPAVVLKLNVVLKETYGTGLLQVWYLLIDRHFILLHVKFEDGSSISVLKNTATRPLTYYFKPRFFRPSSRLSVPIHAKTCAKSQIIEIVSNKFY